MNLQSPISSTLEKEDVGSIVWTEEKGRRRHLHPAHLSGLPRCEACPEPVEGSFFAQEGIEYDERDVTTNEKYMQELTETIGRFATPTIVIGDEVLLGFAANRARIEELLRGD